MTRAFRNAVTLVVDGREVVAPEGTMLVDAAKHGDVEIPVFCYEPKLGEPVGACRMCLVEIEGMPKLQTACSTPVRDGMVVYTQTDQVKEAQNAVVEFLLVNHPLDCPVCDKGGECPLQDIAMGWGPGRSRVVDPKRHFQKPLELSPLVAIDRERCILCYRCVRFSQEVAEDEQLQLLERGDRSYVGTFDDRPYVAPFHGNIIELCPVGALTSYTYRFRARPWDIEQAGSICTLCPSQCNVSFTVRDERVLRVLARDNPEVDDGWLCDKGRFGYQMIHSEDRITEPMIRDGGALRPASWDEALRRVADGLEKAGAKSGLILAGGTSNEEGWLLQRIWRKALGSPHVAPGAGSVAARELLLELARPELSGAVGELDYADAVLIVEADPVHSAPIIDLRIRKAVRRSGARLAVASARPTALDGGAASVARYAPGDGGAFLATLAGALGARGYVGALDESPYAEQAKELVESLKGADDVVVVWGGGLAEGDGSEAALAALVAVARTLETSEHRDSGLLEIPAEPNARGLREVGCIPTAGPGLSATKAGKPAPEIRAGLEDGALGAVLLFEADPVRDHPDSEGWRRALGAAELVVSVAMFEDESTALADVVLPAESHAEKDGTVTHPDGRLQRLRPSIPRPGSARAGWQWLRELSARLGAELEPDTHPAIFEALTADVTLYEGITLDEIGGRGVRWQDRRGANARWKRAAKGARKAAAGAGTRRPREHQATAANTAAERATGSPGPGPGGRLLLGTYRDLWAGEVTERNPALRFLIPAQRLELAPADAERLGVAHGDEVTVSSNGTSLAARVAIRERMAPGAGFLIEGTAEGNANALANGVPRTVEVTKGAAE